MRQRILCYTSWNYWSGTQRCDIISPQRICMMKIYTKTGDQGTTSLFAGGRVSKADVRLHAYGTVDELNATLGLAIALNVEASLIPLLRRIQNELFSVG